MGYSLATELVTGPDITAGIVSAAEHNNARAMVLAYPVGATIAGFRKILSTVSTGVNCPVAVVRFWGELHTERILIPITDIEELAGMVEIISAFNAIGEHKLHILYLLPSTDSSKEVKQQEQKLQDWMEHNARHLTARVEPVITHSRLDEINRAAKETDLIIMHGKKAGGMEKFLFGSLVDSVSVKVQKTLIVVYNTKGF